MMNHSPIKSIFSVEHRLLLAIVMLLMIWVPSAFAQGGKGCEGVGYTKHPRSEYSPEHLKGLLERDPNDVDALVDLGLHLEEQDKILQADALYERAIQAKPDCYLGYYFAGLVAERISEQASSDAEAKIRKAVGLDPRLENDPNVKGFMKRHTRPMASQLPVERDLPSLSRQVLAGSNWFYVGVGVGIFLATLLFYLSRFKRTAPTRT